MKLEFAMHRPGLEPDFLLEVIEGGRAVDFLNRAQAVAHHAAAALGQTMIQGEMEQPIVRAGAKVVVCGVGPDAAQSSIVSIQR